MTDSEVPPEPFPFDPIKPPTLSPDPVVCPTTDELLIMTVSEIELATSPPTPADPVTLPTEVLLVIESDVPAAPLAVMPTSPPAFMPAVVTFPLFDELPITRASALELPTKPPTWVDPVTSPELEVFVSVRTVPAAPVLISPMIPPTLSPTPDFVPTLEDPVIEIVTAPEIPTKPPT